MYWPFRFTLALSSDQIFFLCNRKQILWNSMIVWYLMTRHSRTCAESYIPNPWSPLLLISSEESKTQARCLTTVRSKFYYVSKSVDSWKIALLWHMASLSFKAIFQIQIFEDTFSGTPPELILYVRNEMCRRTAHVCHSPIFIHIFLPFHFTEILIWTRLHLPSHRFICNI